MAKNTSILIDDHSAAFIQEQIAKGEYANASEVIRAALRRYERQERHRAAVLKALEEGEASGISPLSHEEVWARVREAHAQRVAAK